jgi:hypothetical protein
VGFSTKREIVQLRTCKSLGWEGVDTQMNHKSELRLVSKVA